MNYIEGIHRKQLVLFNNYLDEIINDQNPVRFIDAYVDSLDLYSLGINMPKMETGAPPYDPALLLKIYIYCYFERTRSSRKIEKECNRNQELIWLTCQLAPDFKTIADFRKNNKKGLTNIFKDFLKLCKKLNLISLKITATDGTKLRAQNGKNEVYNKSTIDEVQAKIDEKIEHYISMLDENDKKEDIELDPKETEKLLDKINKLGKKKEKVKFIKGLFEADETLEKYFATDPTSRFQSDKGQVAPGYNAQICTDDDNKLIIVGDVTNESNDLKQMTPMVEHLKEIKKDLNIKEKTKNIMDAGYDSEQEIIKNKDDEAVEILVHNKKDAQKSGKHKGKSNKKKNEKVPNEGFDVDNFEYDKENDNFICPEGEKLKRIYKNPGTERSGRKTVTYLCKACESCKSRKNCTNNKKGRSITVSVNREEVNDYHASMKSDENKNILSKRKEIVEHPFGTIKRNWGFGYFMQRGIEKVRAEFNFICFIYNLKRVLNIFSVEKLIKALNG